VKRRSASKTPPAMIAFVSTFTAYRVLPLIPTSLKPPGIISALGDLGVVFKSATDSRSFSAFRPKH
jgi:hypothetical protein